MDSPRVAVAVAYLVTQLLSIVFIVFMPAIYRTLSGPLLKKAAGLVLTERFDSLPQQDREDRVISVSEYHQDLNILTVAALLLSMNVALAPLMISGRIAWPFSLLSNVVYVGLFVVLVVVHKNLDSLEYYKRHERGDTGLLVGLAGPTARWVWMLRTIFSLVLVGLAVAVFVAQIRAPCPIGCRASASSDALRGSASVTIDQTGPSQAGTRPRADATRLDSASSAPLVQGRELKGQSPYVDTLFPWCGMSAVCETGSQVLHYAPCWAEPVNVPSGS